MFTQSLFSIFRMPFGLIANRYFHVTAPRFPVTIVGGGGGIGQPLALLLRTHPLVSKLTLFDLKGAAGAAVDLSHIDVLGKTAGLDCAENLQKALVCSQIVVVPAGMPRKPGQTRDDLFKVNADVAALVADAMAIACPKAFLAIITNPINSTVPSVAEVLKKHGVFDPSRVFGVTTLDHVRARKFIGDHMYIDPKRVLIPVIGGHSAETIVPLMSHMTPEFKGDDDEIVKITKRIKNAGTEVVEAKAGGGSATLSMAYAGAKFVDTLLKALGGTEGVSDTAYVKSCVGGTEYFASSFSLGKDGIIEFQPIPQFSCYESTLINEALPLLEADIKKGIAHGQAYQISGKDSCKPANDSDKK